MSIKNGFFRASAEDFHKIPGNPVAYWLSPEMKEAFQLPPLATIGTSSKGIITGDNARFLRMWQEVPISNIKFDAVSFHDAEVASQRWYPCRKGGSFRKWYGNNEFVIDWKGNGFAVIKCSDVECRNCQDYADEFKFVPSISWTDISTGKPSFRYGENDLSESAGMSFFPSRENCYLALGLLNSIPSLEFLSVLSPTIHFTAGSISRVPFAQGSDNDNFKQRITRLITLSRTDWDSYETSWDFKENPLVAEARHFGEIMLSDVYDVVRIIWAKATVKMRELEIRNNEIFIKAYGLGGELSPDVPWNEVSLTCNPWYRYGREVPETVDAGIYGVVSEMPMDADLEKRLRADTAKELISYAVGCMMGRYSLDRPGLVLADAGGTLEDYRAKLREAGVGAPRFEPDEDGILPILDADWFEDDIVTRLHAFLRAAFGEANFHANVAWIEEALGKDLRSYFVKDFYADHVQRYQKRPVYWLFSSRKGAFQALVYLHRYRPDTPGRVLGYLRSYIAKVAARIEALDRIAADPSAARGTRTSALRERTKLAKAQAEIADYERDVLYPLSTERPALDLDDGVKANYPKLGAALRKIF